MSLHLIDRYYTKLEKLKRFGGSENELSIRGAFQSLIDEYADKKNLLLVPELRIKGTKGDMVQPDGTLKNELRLELGYWESKDSKDDIDIEIENKTRKGYPLTNTLFEDTNSAVLYQHGEEILRVDLKDREKLDKILTEFVSYQPPHIHEFHKALEQFKIDLPHILDALRDLLEIESKQNQKYIDAKEEFLENCRTEINPEFTNEDVREMVIQHILTEEIFNAIFDESHFHMENNIASKLDALIKTFFTGDKRRNTIDKIKHYYNTISTTAKSIADHHEKQKFLKVIYEDFYKSYNPKAADRLGVVYTPNEIVKFMIESTDYLLSKHFKKTLSDENVEILDPATGTGTFICDLIEHIPKDKLDYKYKNEIHANEVAILPYYVANLNIEYTYKQKMGNYSEFPNLCFVDTLDNTSALKYIGKQEVLFGLSSENAERIKRQNEKKISVIIGNPPYNAKQENYNYQNSNKVYNSIDERIKNTYAKEGSTQNKNLLYDMFVRFIRWSSDRIQIDGVISFIVNRTFLNSRSFDGFRKCISKEFQSCIIIDTKSDVRLNPKISGTSHNIFGIQTGVAILFLIKRGEKSSSECNIKYISMDDNWRKETKLEWLISHSLPTIPFEEIKPDKKYNWLNLTDTDYSDFIPAIDKEVKSEKSDEAIFKLFSRGVATQRDEWVYDFNKSNLVDKVKYMVDIYSKTIKNKDYNDKFLIKWDRELSKYLKRKINKKFNESSIKKALYRPYVKMNFYFDKHFNGMTYQWNEIDFESSDFRAIAFNTLGSSKDFYLVAIDSIADLHLTGDTQVIPFRVSKNENVTDWGLQQFIDNYKDKKITKEDIFYYVYGVLHNPNYRTKYELNLKREFPHIPFYKDFWKWSKWGKELMDLHINYEDAEPYKLTRKDESAKTKKEKKISEVDSKAGLTPKVKLKADRENNRIIIDSITTLTRIPKLAWEYKLGNRTAIEWVLEYYKEKKPRDETIREKFNNYKFSDYKEEVIELLRKVTTVSIKTMEIVNKMEKEKDA